jgi:anti-sigma B factor antagonist
MLLDVSGGEAAGAGTGLLLALDVTPEGDRARVRCRGEIDLSNADRIDSEIRGLARRGCSVITLDLRRVGFIDCSGLRVLLELDHLAAQQGWRFELACADGPAQRLLELTRTAGRFARTS